MNQNQLHTPGPWHWVNSSTDEPFDFEAEWDGVGHPSLRTVAEFGENKIEVIDGKTYSSFALPKWILDADPMQYGNDVANARLIAAAPELLAALENYLIQDEIAEGFGGGVGGSARTQAIAAITKATGANHE